MAVTVETGTGVSGADSYIQTTDAQSFATSRGLSVTLTDAHMRAAIDALDALKWKGSKASSSNALAWPRADVTDNGGNDVAEDVVPLAIQRAQVWIAVAIAQGVDLNAVSTPRVKLQKIGALEQEFAVTNGAMQAISVLDYPNVRSLVSEYTVKLVYIDRA